VKEAWAGLDIFMPQRTGRRHITKSCTWTHVKAAAQACEPRTRAASAAGRQPPVRRRGKGASPPVPVGVTGHRPPNPAASLPCVVHRRH
jgi:hypothetical protein